MRNAMLMCAVMLLWSASSAPAADVWFGPKVGLPVPGRDVGGSPTGFAVGVTLQQMDTPYVGPGLDIVYHHWPASSGYRAAYERYLAFPYYRAIEGDEYAFSTVRISVHLKLVAPLRGAFRPWFRPGLGFYRIDRNLTAPDWEGSTSVYVGGGPRRVALVPGACIGAGFDVRRGERTMVGLHAEYHRLIAEDADIPKFSALTVGAHLMFGR